MASTSGWHWSKEHQDYYRIVATGQYEWYKHSPQPQQYPYLQNQPPQNQQNQQLQQMQQPQQQYHYSYQQVPQPQQQPTYQHPSYYPAGSAGYSNGGLPQYNENLRNDYNRRDSASNVQPDSNAWYTHEWQPPRLNPLPEVIKGTSGFRETLDESYTKRNDAREFFKVGRVFSILHSEAASEDALRNHAPYKDSITVVRFGQAVFSQIRRFVVVGERQGYCYACPISTYSGRGTLKDGCNPAEHAIVYVKGTTAMAFDGENGMIVEPIAIDPADSSVALKSASRVRLGKVYPIEWNVKVKNIGHVVSEDMAKLITWSRDKNPEVLTNKNDS